MQKLFSQLIDEFGSYTLSQLTKALTKILPPGDLMVEMQYIVYSWHMVFYMKDYM